MEIPHYVCVITKWAKLKQLQDPNQSNADNVNKEICETTREFRNKERLSLKGKIK
jgi:hypothetical protein